jgi:hypothetical protein
MGGESRASMSGSTAVPSRKAGNQYADKARDAITQAQKKKVGNLLDILRELTFYITDTAVFGWPFVKAMILLLPNLKDAPDERKVARLIHLFTCQIISEHRANGIDAIVPHFSEIISVMLKEVDHKYAPRSILALRSCSLVCRLGGKEAESSLLAVILAKLGKLLAAKATGKLQQKKAKREHADALHVTAAAFSAARHLSISSQHSQLVPCVAQGMSRWVPYLLLLTVSSFCFSFLARTVLPLGMLVP